MNPKLLEYYRSELQHAREMGGEFASEYPKIAGRLGLETLECSDPYVERLLEGFAFLAARVNLKIETSYSRLARHLLELIYPSYLAPVPSMLIAEMTPDLAEGSLAQGFEIPRGTRLRSQITPESSTECDFRTAHNLTLWPVQLTGCKALGSRAAIEAAGVVAAGEARSGIALTLETTGDIAFSALPIDSLSFHLCGADTTGARLYEQVMRHTCGVSVVCDGKEIRTPRKPAAVQRQGFADDEALLPTHSKEFQGYRLLQEYFAFPDRFQFARIVNLAARLQHCDQQQITLLLLFREATEDLDTLADISHFRLNCVPAINLFPKAADRIHLGKQQLEYHVVPDRTRPMDFEVHSVDGVSGFGSGQADKQPFYPYFSVTDTRRDTSAFFTLHREPRELSSKQKQRGTRASYIGSETYLSLVDAQDAPYRSDLRQLAVSTHCTNRDLPLQMPVGRGDTDFYLDIGAPVSAVKCVAGPTIPRASRAHGRDAWHLVSNLSTNYLSISDVDPDNGEQAAAMLRQMLALYADDSRTVAGRQLDGIVAVKTSPSVRQRRLRSHVEVARGLGVELTVDEAAFEGTGAYLMGAVLEQFFARYASVNSYTETSLLSIQRGRIETWPVRLGTRSSL